MSTTPPCGSVHIAEHPQSVHLGQTLNISFPGIPTPFNVSFLLFLNRLYWPHKLIGSANTEKGGATHCWYDRWLFNESWREYQVQPLNQSGQPPREGDDVVWDEGHNIMFVAHDADDGAFIFSDAYHVAAASGLRRSMGALGWSCVVLASLAVVGGWHA